MAFDVMRRDESMFEHRTVLEVRVVGPVRHDDSRRLSPNGLDGRRELWPFVLTSRQKSDAMAERRRGTFRFRSANAIETVEKEHVHTITIEHVPPQCAAAPRLAVIGVCEQS